MNQNYEQIVFTYIPTQENIVGNENCKICLVALVSTVSLRRNLIYYETVTYMECDKTTYETKQVLKQQLKNKASFYCLLTILRDSNRYNSTVTQNFTASHNSSHDSTLKTFN